LRDACVTGVGTIARRRAPDRPIAMACLRLVTFCRIDRFEGAVLALVHGALDFLRLPSHLPATELLTTLHPDALHDGSRRVTA
jgi:hypothetical protein